MASSFATRLGTSPEEGIKAPCVVAATSNITLSGAQTIGSISVVAQDRVLVAGQTDPTENGIYDVANSSWSRSTDFNSAEDVVSGQLVFVPNALYEAVFTGSFSPGVTSITFSSVETVLPNNTTTYELTTDIALNTHASIVTGHSIETKYFNGSRVLSSGGKWVFTGTTDAGQAGTGLHTDGYVYDADGKQFQLDGVMTVYKFGVDYSGDDLAALNIALAAVSAAGGGPLYMQSPGTCLISGVFSFQNADEDIEFWMGPGTTLKLDDAANSHIIHLRGDRCKVIGGKIDGNKANQTVDKDAIHIQAANETTISGVRIHDAKRYGIFAYDSSDLVIENCKFFTGGDIAVLVGNTVAATEVSGVQIINNRVDHADNALGLGAPGIALHGRNPAAGGIVTDAVISDNIINLPIGVHGGSGEVCVEVWGEVNTVTVGGNTCDGGGLGISCGGSFASGARPTDVTISGNTVSNNDRYGIEASVESGAISGNTCDGGGIGNTSVGIGTTGTAPNEGNKLAISGNTIKGYTESCVQCITDSDRVSITGNIMEHAVATQAAVQIFNSNHTNVSNNIIQGSGAAIESILLHMTTQNVSNIVVSGNIIDGFTNGIELRGAGSYVMDNVSLSSNIVTNTTNPYKETLSGGATITNLCGVNNTFPDSKPEKKSITIESPTATEDIVLTYFDEPVTITKLVAVLKGSSPSFSWTMRHDNDRSAAGNEIVTGGTVTTDTTTGEVITVFNDETIPADSFLWLESSASTNVDEINITMFYKRD